MILVLALLALLITTDANATRYWASSGGSNSAVCTDIDGTADPTPNYGSFARAVACATASGDEVYVKAGTYTTNATITNPTSGITIRGESATKASWPVLQPTGTAVKGVAFTSARSNVTFKYLKWDLSKATTGTSCFDGTSSAATTNIVIEDFECLGPPAGQAVDTGAAIGPSSSANGWRISRGKISRWSTADHQPGAHCLYWAGHNSIMEHIECTDYDGHGIQFYVLPTNNVIRNSYFHGATDRDGIYFGSQSNNNTAYNNIVADYTTTGITMHGTANRALHNTIYEASAVPGITISGCATGSACLIANNLIQVGGTAISGTDPDVTQTTNRTTGTHMIDPANGNFSLVEGSAAIDGGTQIAAVGTWPGSATRYVGANPDQGALEACVRSSAVVESATPTIYSVTYSCANQSVRGGVGLQTPTVANWAIRDDTVAQQENSAAIRGQSIVDITMNTSLTAGDVDDAMTRSTAPTLMGNDCIGDPNTACFNAHIRTHAVTAGKSNVGGGGGVTYNVVHFRQVNWYSSVAAPSWKKLQDSAAGAQAGGRVAVAITIEGTGANPDPTPFEFYFNTGGADAAVTDSATTNAVAFANDASSFQDQQAVSSLLTGLTCPHGAFVAGAVIGAQNTQPNIDLSQNSCTTLIVLLQTKSTATGTINLKPKLPGGTVISYGVQPAILIKTAEAGS